MHECVGMIRMFLLVRRAAAVCASNFTFAHAHAAFIFTMHGPTMWAPSTRKQAQRSPATNASASRCPQSRIFVEQAVRLSCAVTSADQRDWSMRKCGLLLWVLA